jgi:hypothetical protein
MGCKLLLSLNYLHSILKSSFILIIETVLKNKPFVLVQKVILLLYLESPFIVPIV